MSSNETYCKVHRCCSCYDLGPLPVTTQNQRLKLGIYLEVMVELLGQGIPIARPLPTQNSITQENVDIYPYLKRDSDPQSQCSTGLGHAP
jgi:hypothetical protein